METATFAGGCFWCTEAIFKKLRGVKKVTPGYTGGKTENPTYEQVCAGFTGHAEAINMEFDSEEITYENLLYVFFKMHDPTQLNRQGADAGTQYRSAIFYHDREQKQKAEEFIQKLEKEKVYDKKVVTTLEEFDKFYQAEDYHQDYYKKNPSQVYCRLVIDPKIDKLKKDFQEYLS